MKKIITLFLFCIIFSAMPALGGSVPTIDKDELKALLDSDTLVLFDVRTGRDWSSSGEKIKHAIRVDGGDLSAAKTFPKDSTFVLYCAWPNEATSASLAQKLINKGYSNVFALKGGWREWSRNKYPVEEK